MWYTRLRLWLLLALVSGVYCDVDPIVIKGSKLFYKTNGTQFFIKGLAYQTYLGDLSTSDISTSDYLAVQTACSRDVPVFQDLGINTITVFNVDATQNHDYCMGLLQNAGIYVIPYLRELNTDGMSTAWTTEGFSEKTDIIDAFAQYNNVLAFLVDEVTLTDANDTTAVPLFKAAVRDVKAYIASKGYRSIPIGIDDGAFVGRFQSYTLDYFNCGNMADSVDIYGASVFSWCGDANMANSGYDEFTHRIENYPVPVFMSQYGCEFSSSSSSIAALYGSDMTPYWSGGVWYTYAGPSFGLVNASGQSVDKGSAYSSFSSQIASITLTPTNSASYTPTNTPTTCPDVDGSWEASPTLPPQPDAGYCGCLQQQSCCQLLPDLNSTMQIDVVQNICGQDSSLCEGLMLNATLGEYGMYSMCNTTTQLSLLMSNNTQQSSDSGNADCMLSGSDSYASKNPAYATPTAQCTYQTLTAAATTISTASSTPGSADTGSKPGVTSAPNSSGSSHSGLSGGAIAGIVIGVIAGIAIIAAAAVIVIRRQRAKASALGASETGPGVPEMSTGVAYETAELYGSHSIPPTELDDTGVPSELPAR